MSVVNKLVFKAKVDGSDVELAVLRPGRDEIAHAKVVAGAAFKKAVDSGALLRLEVEKLVKDRNLWGDAQKAEEKRLADEIRKKEKELLKGGIKKSAGRDLAVSLIDLRKELNDLRSTLNELDNMTAEAKNDDEYFNSLVAQSTVYADTGKKFYKDYADFQSKAEEPVTYAASANLLKLLTASVSDRRKSLPEYKFLLQYKFVNDDLNFINKDGKLTDRDGRLINDEGRYVNEAGEYVDASGNRVDVDGNLVVESTEFLDD